MKDKLEKLIIEVLKKEGASESFLIKRKLDEEYEGIDCGFFAKKLHEMVREGSIEVYPIVRSSSNKILGFLYRTKKK